MDIKEVANIAKKLLEKDKELVPILFVEDIKGKKIGITLSKFGADKEHDKYKMMRDAGIAISEKGVNVKEIVLVAESWIAEAKKEEDAKNIVPSECLDRKEAIVVSRWNISNNEREIHIQIFERDNDKIIWKEIKDEKMDEDSKLNILEPFIEGLFQAKSKSTDNLIN